MDDKGLLQVFPKWAVVTFGSAFALLLLVGLAIVIWRLGRGDDFGFKGLNLKGKRTSKLVNEYIRDIENLTVEHKLIHDKHEIKRVLLKASQDLLTDMVSYLKGEIKVPPSGFITRCFELILDALLKSVGDSATNPHRAGISMPDPDQPALLRLYQGRGFTAKHIQDERLAIDRSAAGYVYKLGIPYINNHLSLNHDNIYYPRPEGTYPYESLICLPLRVGNKVDAVITIDAKQPSSFTEEHKSYVEHCAALLALVFVQVSAKGVQELLALSKQKEGESFMNYHHLDNVKVLSGAPGHQPPMRAYMSGEITAQEYLRSIEADQTTNQEVLASLERFEKTIARLKEIADFKAAK